MIPKDKRAVNRKKTRLILLGNSIRLCAILFYFLTKLLQICFLKMNTPGNMDKVPRNSSCQISHSLPWERENVNVTAQIEARLLCMSFIEMLANLEETVDMRHKVSKTSRNSHDRVTIIINHVRVNGINVINPNFSVTWNEPLIVK